MKSLLLLGVFFLFIGLSLTAQEQYSYSFKGDTDSTSLVIISKKLEKIHGVSSVKSRYKIEKKSGEFIISSEKGSKNDPHPFHPADIKAAIIEHGFEPISFRKIK